MSCQDSAHLSFIESTLTHTHTDTQTHTHTHTHTHAHTHTRAHIGTYQTTRNHISLFCWHSPLLCQHVPLSNQPENEEENWQTIYNAVPLSTLPNCYNILNGIAAKFMQKKLMLDISGMKIGKHVWRNIAFLHTVNEIMQNMHYLSETS